MNKLYELIDDKMKWGEDEDGLVFKSCPSREWLIEKCDEYELPLPFVEQVEEHWDNLVHEDLQCLGEMMEQVRWENANRGEI